MLYSRYNPVVRVFTAVALCLLFSLPTFAALASESLTSSCARKGTSHHCCCKSKAGSVGISSTGGACPSRCGQMTMLRLSQVPAEVSAHSSADPIAETAQVIEAVDPVSGHSFVCHSLHQRPPPSV